VVAEPLEVAGSSTWAFFQATSAWASVGMASAALTTVGLSHFTSSLTR